MALSEIGFFRLVVSLVQDNQFDELHFVFHVLSLMSNEYFDDNRLGFTLDQVDRSTVLKWCLQVGHVCLAVILSPERHRAQRIPRHLEQGMT